LKLYRAVTYSKLPLATTEQSNTADNRCHFTIYNRETFTSLGPGVTNKKQI